MIVERSISVSSDDTNTGAPNETGVLNAELPEELLMPITGVMVETVEAYDESLFAELPLEELPSNEERVVVLIAPSTLTSAFAGD